MTRKMSPMTVLKLPADHGERPPVGTGFDDVVVDDDERERADPGTLDPPEAADDGHDEQIDRRDRDRGPRRDLAVPPDVENAGQRRR